MVAFFVSEHASQYDKTCQFHFYLSNVTTSLNWLGRHGLEPRQAKLEQSYHLQVSSVNCAGHVQIAAIEADPILRNTYYSKKFVPLFNYY